MTFQIRAMSFAELLDTAFRLVRDHFVLLVGITAAIYVPMAVLSEGLPMTPTGRIPWLRLATTAGLALVAVPLATTALTHAVGEICLGRQATIAGSFRVALALSVPLTGTMLLVYLGVLAGLLCFIVPGLYWGVAWMFTSPIVVLERRTGTAAMVRSRALMRGNMGRATAALVLGWIIVALVQAVLTQVLRFVPLLGGAGRGIAESVGVSYSAVVLVLLYFDARCRREAFDLEHLAQLVERNARDAAA